MENYSPIVYEKTRWVTVPTFQHTQGCELFQITSHFLTFQENLQQVPDPGIGKKLLSEDNPTIKDKRFSVCLI